MKQKLCFITNIGPHYRLPIFQKISETFSCDFYLGDHINTKIKAFDYKLSEEITYGNEVIVSEIKLPKSNVLKYILEDDSWFVVRPSGTEPKMKIYLSVVGKSLKDSEEKLNSFKNSVMNRINNILA